MSIASAGDCRGAHKNEIEVDMLARIIKPFPYAHDGIQLEDLTVGMEREISDGCAPGLIKAGYIKAIAADAAAVAASKPADPVDPKEPALAKEHPETKIAAQPQKPAPASRYERRNVPPAPRSR